MAIPSSAVKLPQALDPADVDFFGVDITQGPQGVTPFPLLAPGEAIASFTIAPQPEAMDKGLEIKTGVDPISGATYPPVAIVGNTLTLWLGVQAAKQSLSDFNAGVLLGIELTITTNSTPPRKKQRTFTVAVVNQ